ncbi:WAP four-disulfide core domain protein 18-like isoform X2 [Rana temporaria]|uniref:WAP four-disulfide core domain protein 18-like isoform X2 n=1 Tax=Rana temporaria TaxID=8407 RepID=UPI001AAC7544|nr:WAP four-disulfide core domain protein 18-like isoform X2 [Rana temporaria]
MRLAGLTLSILLGVLLLQVVTAAEEKPGTCIVVNTFAPCEEPIPRRCHGDSECSGTKKCCDVGCSFRCEEPITEEKPGTCPVVNTFAPCEEPIPRRCNGDSECSGTKKCCDVGCAYDCEEPE